MGRQGLPCGPHGAAAPGRVLNKSGKTVHGIRVEMKKTQSADRQVESGLAQLIQCGAQRRTRDFDQTLIGLVHLDHHK